MKLSLKISIFVAYVITIAINYLANIIPIGGYDTGQLSDMYPNLFTPAGITFSIWGLIYSLLAVYVIYNLTLTKKNKLAEKIAKLFLVSSVANVSWIFAWHYQIVPLSLVFMITILVSLILIAEAFKDKKLSTKEYIALKLPFSIYFGWITIATIANVTVLLVDLNWGGWGITDATWTIIVLLIGAAIGITTSLKNKNIPYNLVLIWAYFGIWIKHTSESGFNSQYPEIITTLWICIALFALSTGYTGYKLHNSK